MTGLTELAQVQLTDGDTIAWSSGIARKLPLATNANATGIHPTEFKLLVKPKPAEEVSKGGIIIPTSTAEAEKFAQTEGVVIAVSPLAFTYAKDEEWEAAGAKPPQPGQTVLYAKYAGNWVKGKDGGEYLLINDKDVGAIIED